MSQVRNYKCSQLKRYQRLESYKVTQNKLYVLPQLARTVWVKFRKQTHKIISLVFFDFILLGYK